MMYLTNKGITIINEDEKFEIGRDRYIELVEYVRNGKKTDYINDIISRGLEKCIFSDASQLATLMQQSLKTIPNSLNIPRSINIELTNRCPLRCPQCYCSLEKGEDIDINIAKKYIKEASKLGIQLLSLSGGETLAYPHLIDMIEYASKNNVKTAVALSGWNFDKEILKKLTQAGVTEIYISLNGSTEKINSVTRDGYEYALSALHVLKESDFQASCINWVAHGYNIDDFPDMVKVCEKYGVKKLAILAPKPNSKNEMKMYPNPIQLKKLASMIEMYKKDDFTICVEPCFGPLISFIQSNYGFTGMCLAGYANMSISVDGRMTPCRHIDVRENFDSILSYWNESEMLRKLRSGKEVLGDSCSKCERNDVCQSCMAIPFKLENKVYRNNCCCER